MARSAPSLGSPIVVLDPPSGATEGGRLVALMSPYDVDGRVSWHAPSVRGVATANCYLLVEGDSALLCDTGLAVHERALLEQIETCLTPSTSLSLLVLRQGELDSIANLAAIAARFSVTMVHAQYERIEDWSDIHSRPALRMTGPASRFPDLQTHPLQSRDSISVDPAGTRPIEVVVPRLRLLRTHWAFDAATGTLFSSDFFSYAIRPDRIGPWVVTAVDDPTDEALIEEHLLRTRYWWLADASLDAVRRDLAAIFDEFAVRRIAPAFGCVLEGQTVVARHYAMIDDLLRRLGRTGASPPRVGQTRP
jgi:hypothetical protein